MKDPGIIFEQALCLYCTAAMLLRRGKKSFRTKRVKALICMTDHVAWFYPATPTRGDKKELISMYQTTTKIIPPYIVYLNLY
jgi:hypothetical protein